MIRLTLDQLHAALRAQGVSDPLHSTFRCPACKTLQSPADLIDAGAGKTFAEVERYAGFSCVGRWTGAGGPRAIPDGKPCNWTLGGLFRIHTVEVVGPDGRPHPFFDIATPAEAQAHEAAWRAKRQ